MYFSRGTTLIGSAAVLDSCSVSFLAVSSSLSPPPPLPGAARKKKPFPSTTSRIPYSRLLRRSFQLGAYSSSSRSLEQASFGRLRNGCLEKRCGHASASVGSTGEGRRGVIPRGDGFEKVQIDARVCKILLGAAVAARVVVAFASENLSNGSSSHELHEHDAEGAHAAHHHTHEEHEHHHDHEQQCSHQHHHHRTEELNQVQRLVQRLSEVTGIATVADAWRDNLAVCCASTVLLLLGAVVPFVIPKQQSASSLQSLLVIPALPLTGVCTSRQEILARYSICWYDLLNSGKFA
jgi:hypothetical protein